MSIRRSPAQRRRNSTFARLNFDDGLRSGFHVGAELGHPLGEIHASILCGSAGGAVYCLKLRQYFSEPVDLKTDDHGIGSVRIAMTPHFRAQYNPPLVGLQYDRMSGPIDVEARGGNIDITHGLPIRQNVATRIRSTQLSRFLSRAWKRARVSAGFTSHGQCRTGEPRRCKT